MANINIQFLDYKDKQCIEVRAIDDIISIFTMHEHGNNTGVCIHLDKSTAIKFAKTLRTEINKIKS